MFTLNEIFLLAHVPKTSVILFFTIVVILTTLLWKSGKQSRKLPPGPWCLPVVGYLPFLGNEPHRTIDNLSKKYGNIFSLYMGSTYVVILSDYAAVKEAFSKWETAHRPPDLFKFIPYGLGLAGVNRQVWIEQRRFCVNAMRDLGLGRSEWTRVIQEEISDFLPLVQKHNGQAINISKHLTSSVSNNMSFLVFGKRLRFGDPNRGILDQSLSDVMQVLTQAGFCNFFPRLAKLMIKFNIGGFSKSFIAVENFSNYMRNEIDLHKTQSRPSSSDFIYKYLDEMEVQQREDPETSFKELNLIGNTQVLYIAGVATIRISLNWLILAMATYKDIQKKVQAELDSLCGGGRRASWEDRSNLPYTYAVIMEGQRWKTILPLNTFRMTREDIKLGNFHIPKGTTIIANNWGLHSDERYWKDPEKFIPERFLINHDREVNLKMESYVPFSYGKRNCPGETMALMEIFLYFTALLQSFEIRTPSGEASCFDSVLSITNEPVPQTFCFIPRSPAFNAQ